MNKPSLFFSFPFCPEVISYSCALRPLWLSAAGLLGALRRSLLRADVAALGAAMAGMGWRRALRWVRRMEEDVCSASPLFISGCITTAPRLPGNARA